MGVHLTPAPPEEKQLSWGGGTHTCVKGETYFVLWGNKRDGPISCRFGNFSYTEVHRPDGTVTQESKTLNKEGKQTDAILAIKEGKHTKCHFGNQNCCVVPNTRASIKCMHSSDNSRCKKRNNKRDGPISCHFGNLSYITTLKNGTVNPEPKNHIKRFPKPRWDSRAKGIIKRFTKR